LAGYAIDGHWHIAMRPACRTLRLDWEGQRQRIMRDPILSEGACIIKAPSAGGQQDMTCLRLDLFWGWLFKLELSRLEPDVRDLLIPFQRAGYEALHEHFTGAPVATHPTPADIDTLTRQVAQLSAAVARLRIAQRPALVVERPLHPIAVAILETVSQVGYPVTAAEITRRLRSSGLEVGGKYVSVRMRRLMYAGYLVHVTHGVYALPGITAE
jgi:hypothetical protein